MDDSERDGLLQSIRQLEQTARRWRSIAMTALVVLLLFVVAGVIGVGATSFLVVNRARQAEMMAREQAEFARVEAKRAEAERLAAEKLKKAEPAKKGKGKG
jgi:hypothetical protein